MKLNKTQKRIVAKHKKNKDACIDELKKVLAARNVFITECENFPNEHSETIKRTLELRADKLSSSMYILDVRLERYKN